MVRGLVGVRDVLGAGRLLKRSQEGPMRKAGVAMVNRSEGLLLLALDELGLLDMFAINIALVIDGSELNATTRKYRGRYRRSHHVLISVQHHTPWNMLHVLTILEHQLSLDRCVIWPSGNNCIVPQSSTASVVVFVRRHIPSTLTSTIAVRTRRNSAVEKTTPLCLPCPANEQHRKSQSDSQAQPFLSPSTPALANLLR